MKNIIRKIVKRLKHKAFTKMGQILNLRTARYIYSEAQLNNTRPSIEASQYLHVIGYEANSYKLCLQNEAQLLRARSSYGLPNSAWAGIYMPINRLVIYQIKTNILKLLSQFKSRLTDTRVTENITPTSITWAGLFMGMDYQYFS